METAIINLKLSSAGILKPSIPTKESLPVMTIVLLCVQLSNESSKIYCCVLIAFYLCEIENVNSSNKRCQRWLKFRIKSPMTIWLKNSLKSNSEFIYFSFNWLEIHKFHAGTRRWTLSINFLKFLKHHSTSSVNTFDKHSSQINSFGKIYEASEWKKVEFWRKISNVRLFIVSFAWNLWNWILKL